MTLLLSELNLRSPETHQFQGDQPYDYELLVTCPQSLSRGYKRVINLPHGLSFGIWNFQLHEELVEEKLPSQAVVEFELGFNLSGSYDGGLGNWSSFVEFGPIEPSTKLIYREWLPGGWCLKVDLCMSNLNGGTFDDQQYELIPPDVQTLVEQSQEGFAEDLGAIHPDVQFVLQQVVHCPYDGWTQKLYLEAKALELIALQSAYALKREPSSTTTYPLRSSQIDQIYAARDLLIAHAEHPPSLVELARLVELNDCTLKRGFRQVFGTTVFGYLRKHRLAQARWLLMEGKLSVAEVACQVGYSHSGYFAAAFKREFGVSPGTYLMNRRKEI